MSFLYASIQTTEKGADPLGGQPTNISRGWGFTATEMSQYAVPAKRTTNGHGVYMPRPPTDTGCLPVTTDTNSIIISARRHPESALRAPVEITGACIHFPKMQEPPQNAKPLGGAMQQAAY